MNKLVLLGLSLATSLAACGGGDGPTDPPQTCQDPKATNVGREGECVYPPPAYVVKVESNQFVNEDAGEEVHAFLLFGQGPLVPDSIDMGLTLLELTTDGTLADTAMVIDEGKTFYIGYYLYGTYPVYRDSTGFYEYTNDWGPVGAVSGISLSSTFDVSFLVQRWIREGPGPITVVSQEVDAYGGIGLEQAVLIEFNTPDPEYHRLVNTRVLFKGSCTGDGSVVLDDSGKTSSRVWFGGREVTVTWSLNQYNLSCKKYASRAEAEAALAAM